MEILALEILIEKTNSNGVFITHLKICPLAAKKGQFALPVDRLTVKNLTVEPSGRLPGRPCQILRAIALWPVDRPVDRGWKQGADSLCGRPPGRPEAFPESRALGGRPTRSTGLPSKAVCTFCARRSTGLVDRSQLRSTGPVDRQPASQIDLGLKILGFYLL